MIARDVGKKPRFSDELPEFLAPFSPCGNASASASRCFFSPTLMRRRVRFSLHRQKNDPSLLGACPRLT